MKESIRTSIELTYYSIKYMNKSTTEIIGMLDECLKNIKIYKVPSFPHRVMDNVGVGNKGFKHDIIQLIKNLAIEVEFFFAEQDIKTARWGLKYENMKQSKARMLLRRYVRELEICEQ